MNPQPLPQIFTDSLLEHRRELDEIDAHLVSLLGSRFAVTRRIGALKARHGVAGADPARERAQLERLLVLSAGVAAEARPVLVTADLNVRVGPGTEHPSVGVIRGGSTAEVGRCFSGWC